MLKKILSLLILTIFLSSCGFRLKGFNEVKSDAYKNIKVSVVSSPGNHDLRVIGVLKQKIKGFNFEYVSNVKDSNYYIEIIDAKYNKEIQTKSSTGLIKQYLLKFYVKYIIYKHSSKGEFNIVKSTDVIHLQTDYTYEPQNILGSDSEEDIIAANLRKDAASRILNVLIQTLEIKN